MSDTVNRLSAPLRSWQTRLESCWDVGLFDILRAAYSAADFRYAQPVVRVRSFCHAGLHMGAADVAVCV